MAGLLGWNAVLNLPNVVITGRDEDEESYLIHAESEATVRLCPGCGDDAMEYWENWLRITDSETKKHFAAAITAFRNWSDEIFNWWDYRYTNALTESLNNLIKAAFRSGRGYSFDVLRAKLLFTKGGLETTAESLNKPRPDPTEMILIEEPELFLHGTRIDMPVPAFELVADHTDTHNQS